MSMRWDGTAWVFNGYFGPPRRQPRRYWYRAGEVAKAINVSPRTVRRWVVEGRLKAQRTPGGRLRFAAADVMRWLSTHAVA